MRLSRSLGFWLGIAVGLALLALAVRKVELDSLVEALRRTDPVWVLPFLSLLFSFYALKSLRWGILIRGIGRVPFRLLFRAVIIGYAGNAILPAQLGDFVRAFVASREMGLPAAPLLTSVFVERAFDLAIVAVFLGIVLAMRPELAGALAGAGIGILLLCVLSLWLLHLYSRRTARLLALVERVAAGLSDRRRQRVLELARSAAHGAAAVAEPRAFGASLSLSAAKWLLMAGCNYLSLRALGIGVPPEAALLVLAWTTLALILPSAPGYAGAIQAAYVFGLAPFGVSASDAVAASLFFHVLSYASVVLAGLWYLHASGYRFAELRAQVGRSQ